MNGFFTNPFVLAILVIIITRLVRVFKWKEDGVKALWLTMGWALVAALVERLLTNGVPNFFICELASEPVDFLTCLTKLMEAILAEWGIILCAAQLIYQALRREIVGGRSLLGGDKAILADIL